MIALVITEPIEIWLTAEMEGMESDGRVPSHLCVRWARHISLGIVIVCIGILLEKKWAKMG